MKKHTIIAGLNVLLKMDGVSKPLTGKIIQVKWGRFAEMEIHRNGLIRVYVEDKERPDIHEVIRAWLSSSQPVIE